MSVTLASDGSVPRKLFGAPNVTLLNVSDIIWGTGLASQTTAQSYNYIWRWITSFPRLKTLDLSTSTFDCLFYPEPRPYWTFSLGTTTIRKLVLRMGYPRGFLGATFPTTFGLGLQELDMCLYNGTSLPIALQRVPNLIRLSMDRSVFDPSVVSVEDVVNMATQTPLLEELSMTGVVGIHAQGLAIALPQWRRLQVLYLGETKMANVPVLPLLRVLDVADVQEMQWAEPHPIRMTSLRCLVAGSLQFDERDNFPKLEFLDLRHGGSSRRISSVFRVPSNVVFPHLRRVCVVVDEISACRNWTSAECTASDVCRKDINVCGLPQYPVQPPGRTWGSDVIAYSPSESAQCPLCRSTCFHDSVEGSTPPWIPIDA
eukprot:PhF_6_TR24486/c0_g1_i1/m.33847